MLQITARRSRRSDSVRKTFLPINFLELASPDGAGCLGLPTFTPCVLQPLSLPVSTSHCPRWAEAQRALRPTPSPQTYTGQTSLVKRVLLNVAVAWRLDL